MGPLFFFYIHVYIPVNDIVTDIEYKIRIFAVVKSRT